MKTLLTIVLLTLSLNANAVGGMSVDRWNAAFNAENDRSAKATQYALGGIELALITIPTCSRDDLARYYTETSDLDVLFSLLPWIINKGAQIAGKASARAAITVPTPYAIRFGVTYYCDME